MFSGDVPEGSVVHLVTITFPPGLACVGGRELRQRGGLLAEGLDQGASSNEVKLIWGKRRALPSGLPSSKDHTDICTWEAGDAAQGPGHPMPFSAC